jgi:hypothetical protein
MTFKIIRNYLEKYKKEDIIDRCYRELEIQGEENFNAIWFIFLIMKWTYLYAEQKYPYRKLEEKDFYKLYGDIAKLNDNHVLSFMEENRLDRAMHVMHTQQFYLQKSLCKEKFATQIKLYTSIEGEYNISKSFFEKTGLNVTDLMFCFQVVWITINATKVDNTSKIKYTGFITQDIINVISEFKDVNTANNFIKLLTLDPDNAIETINKVNSGIKKEELQSIEKTFFTLFPFQVYKKNNIKIIHGSVFNYTANHFIYDYMKINDTAFTTEFGARFEKYIECGIRELDMPFRTENELKKVLPKHSKVVDFIIDNILIECKAIELQSITNANPSDDNIYNSTKDSILKAYNKQMLGVIKGLNINTECFGIILTYKQLYWSRFTELYDIGKKDIDDNLKSNCLPPENVFIIDYYVWDKIVQIVKDKKATLVDILKKAKLNNSISTNVKQLFEAHLDEYKLEQFNLTYLSNELDLLDFYWTKGKI